MRRFLISLLFVVGGVGTANAQYGCGTPYTSPCQVQIQPQQNLGQQMFNMANSFDPAGAMRKADLDYQNYQLQQQEIEIRKLQNQKKLRELQQQQ